MGGIFFNYAVEIGLGTVITKFHEDFFRHSKVVRGDTHTDTQTARGTHKPTFILSKYGK
jgi:hypothetical protein